MSLVKGHKATLLCHRSNAQTFHHGSEIYTIAFFLVVLKKKGKKIDFQSVLSAKNDREPYEIHSKLNFNHSNSSLDLVMCLQKNSENVDLLKKKQFKMTLFRIFLKINF